MITQDYMVHYPWIAFNSNIWAYKCSLNNNIEHDSSFEVRDSKIILRVHYSGA